MRPSAGVRPLILRVGLFPQFLIGALNTGLAFSFQTNRPATAEYLYPRSPGIFPRSSAIANEAWRRATSLVRGSVCGWR